MWPLGYREYKVGKTFQDITIGKDFLKGVPVLGEMRPNWQMRPHDIKKFPHNIGDS